ncbi:serine hydrolase domain-containing protein [Nonomuraea soli]|uniref:D-alanyl-D-alanine carboxypeptidase n=1 Tax=Nonomuraea soli TaxID=1032476 RepID=A0A7W0CFX2_9ACTN|nr:serine hydrolase domain-containing protein [Nonomuraea soli]MBA2890458.1 D-alanyl-D-alanine carboxypeptidase [Nonomuraea soli]
MRRLATALSSTALLTLLTLCTVAPPAHAGDGDVQRALDTLARDSGVVGAIGALYVDGRRAGHGSAGSRLAGGKGGRIPSGARYRVGSQTKLMTAAIVGQLAQEGRFGLDDKLADLLPVGELVPAAAQITVRQLLRHTSGIPDYWQSGRFDDFDFTTYYSPQELVAATRDLPRTGAPGERFAYSNTNYVLLGMIIERFAGTSLADAFAQRVFQPLGMTRSYLPTRPPQGVKGPHGHGYLPDAQGALVDVDRQNASYGGAAGGVISTSDDMARFHRALHQGTLPGGPDGPGGGDGGGPVGGGLCGDALPVRVAAGNAPGFMAVTYSTADGRRQFAVSATLRVKDYFALGAAVDRAAKAVLCPEG